MVQKINQIGHKSSTNLNTNFKIHLRQTHRHKKVLSKYLGIDESRYSPTVISFVGDVEFKTELPSNVLTFWS